MDIKLRSFQLFLVALISSLLSVSAVFSATILLNEDFAYSNDADLDASWPKVGNAITFLGTDPDDSGITTLFSKGDRRHKTFAEITPTNEEPLYLRVEYYDESPGIPGREYIGLWASPFNHGNRLIEVGLHNHAPSHATARYTARVYGSAQGVDWFDLQTQRSAGWRLIELWVYANRVEIYFDGVLDTSANWAGGALGAVRLGFGSGDAHTASHTGVHYKNLRIEQRSVVPYYETAFDGFVAGDLHDQDGWIVEQGSAAIVVDGVSGGRSVVLDPGAPRTRIGRDFPEFALEPVVFVDFSVRGGAGKPPENAPEASSPNTFHVAIVAEEGIARFYVFDGDGSGSGVWKPTSATVPIDTNDNLLGWSVVTVRLDYVRQTFDLYVDGVMAGFGYNFVVDNEPAFSRFTLSGNPEMVVLLDDFYASPVPAIFENRGRDGIADWWKSLHGLSLHGDLRDQKLYSDGFTNIARYYHQTGFTTEPRGVVIFHDDFESGSLQKWTPWTSSSSLSISGEQNRTARGAHSARVTSSSQKMYRNLVPSVQGSANFTFWIYDDMGSQTRWYGEARSGTQQVFAIGRHDVAFGTGTGSLTGERVDPSRYQGRVFAGANAGWFNLDGPDAPRRSPGWHKFEIRRLSDGTTIEFYVNGILSRTILGASYFPIDMVSMGAGVGTVAGNAWFDEVRAERLEPAILAQPNSAIRRTGSTTWFSASAAGNGMTYQWQRNGQNIPGATGPSLFLHNINASAGGEYRLAVTNDVGTTVSNPAWLAVVTEEPSHKIADLGSTATFSVNAGQIPVMTYQWRKDGAPLANGYRITGVNTPHLVINNVVRGDEGRYTVLLSVPGFQFETRPGLLTVNGQVVFHEDFSSGSLSNWTQVPSSSKLTISTFMQSPFGGQQTAQLSSSRNKMYRNLGTDVGGHARAVFWIYDNGTSPDVRWFGEVRAYETSGFSANNKLDQVLAIGKYHVAFGGGTGTLAGEVMNPNKYQARVAFGENTGWFNLDAPGSPNVSVGWRKFEIERMPDGTTINFYVDGILSRTITAADYAPWDVVTIGSVGHYGLDPVLHNAWFGGVTVEYFNSSLEEGLRGLWRLTDASGTTAADWSGNGNHGHLSATGVDWRSDGFGIALDGTGQVTVPHPQNGSLNFAGTSVTMAAWFRTSESGWQTILSKGGHYFDPGYALGIADGKVFATIGGETLQLHMQTAADFNDGKWHFAVAMFDRDWYRGSIYINGIKQPLNYVLGGTLTNGNTLDFSGVTAPTSSTGYNFLIGAIANHANIPADRFVGDLAEVCVFNRALSEGEVELLHSADSSGSGIPDWWKLHYFGHLLYDPNHEPLNDGVTLLQAFDLGLNPLLHDSNGDGLPDAWTVQHFASFDGGTGRWAWVVAERGRDDDPDGDALSNFEEFQLGTNPIEETLFPMALVEGGSGPAALSSLESRAAALEYLAWINGFQGAEAPPLNQRKPSDNPSGDTLSNLWKFAFGMKPMTSYPSERRRHYAIITYPSGSGNQYLASVFQRKVDAGYVPLVRMDAEVKSVLTSPWKRMQCPVVLVEQLSGGWEKVTVLDELSIFQIPGSTRFMQINLGLAATEPETISGLVQWLSADFDTDEYVDDDGSGKVETWFDRTDTAYDVGQQNPLYRPNFVHRSVHPSGAGAIRFDGNQQYLTGQPVLENNMEHGALLVVWHPASFKDAILWEQSGSGGGVSLRVNADGTYGLTINGALTEQLHSYRLGETITSIVAFSRNGSTGETTGTLYHNGREIEGASIGVGSVVFSHQDVVSIGGTSAGGFSHGEVVEILFYNACFFLDRVNYLTDVMEWAYGLYLDRTPEQFPVWWQYRHFGGLVDPGGDPDLDGFTNLEEYLFGLNPQHNDRQGATIILDYDYDQLVSVSGPDLTISYEYDPAGNIEAASTY